MDSAGASDHDGKSILVVGGGIAGITAALEAAEAGARVILIERSPFLGGRTAAFHLYFPKLCPPACGLEINFRRLKNNPRITVLTQAELESLAGTAGNFKATVRLSPRFVSGACTLCGACVEACPAERSDEFNFGLSRTKAIYFPHAMAYPAAYAIDRSLCPEGCTACANVCRYDAIHLTQAPERRVFSVAAVIAATGWAPYNAARLAHLGYGTLPNVVTNVVLERMAAPNGPTRGKIVRPSDGKPPESVAFVQCAGSRDENHLPYCSSVCCSASLKHSAYIHAEHPEVPVSVFYIDIRTPGLLDEFRARVTADSHLTLVKGRVGRIEEDPNTHDLFVTVEDALAGRKSIRKFGLVVLATGMVPQSDGLPSGFERDEYGFVADGAPGFYAAGCAKRPEEVAATVRDATGAALRALPYAVRSGRHE